MAKSNRQHSRREEPASSTSIPTVQFICPHRGQANIILTKKRFRVVACGRRWGKTELGKQIIMEMALNGATCWWLSPTYLMASQVWRDLKATLAPLPDLTINEAERRIDLASGGMIAVRSAHDPDLLRGAGLRHSIKPTAR